jgi:hypothetical protein
MKVPRCPRLQGEVVARIGASEAIEVLVEYISANDGLVLQGIDE